MHGVPTLSFDHCGMHDSLRDSAGILIPIAPQYSQCVESVATAIDHLLDDPVRFRLLATATINRSKEYTWEKRSIYLNQLYKKLLSK